MGLGQMCCCNLWVITCLVNKYHFRDIHRAGACSLSGCARVCVLECTGVSAAGWLLGVRVLICIATAPPIANQGQGSDQCKLTSSRFYRWAVVFLAAREQKLAGQGTVILNLMVHVIQTELKGKLSLCVRVVLAPGISSAIHKRIVRRFAH